MITVPETPLPPVLYKYLPPERLDVLTGLRIRLSAPTEFNDTFDTYHLLSRVPGRNSTVDRIRLRNSVGVFCLSEKADNHLMWVNYARAHSGFVIGFKADDPFFNEDGRTLRKVIYQTGPLVFPTSDENACFYKSSDWKYEEEWRCVRKFEKAETRLVDIAPELINEIIFGHLMAPGDMATVAYHAKAFGIDPKISFSSPLHKTWKIVNTAKKVISCEHCDGQGFRVESLPTE